MPILANIIAWLTMNAARLAIIGALSMLLGIGIYMKGAENTAAKCAANSAEALANDTNTRSEIHEHVMRMRGDDVDRALNDFLRPAD